MKKRKFKAELADLHAMLLWIREGVECPGMQANDLGKIELSCEEALVNIIQHAYQNAGGEIEVLLQESKDRITIVIKDRGPAFNPLLAGKEIDLTLPLEERKEGGLGIFFIKQMMDEVHYERKEDTNILTLVKKRFY